MRAFARLVRDAAGRLENGRRPPDLTGEMIVGGIYEVVYSRLLAGEIEDLLRLMPDLAYSLMQPYIGDVAARKEAAKPPSAATPGTAAARA
jgi:hypothetical protein